MRARTRGRLYGVSGAAGASVVMMLMAGCGSSAPQAAPVSAPGTQAAATGTQPGAADPQPGSTPQESSSATPAIPTVDPTEESSSASPTQTPGACFDSASLNHPEVTSDTETGSYGSAHTYTDGSEKLKITASKGTPHDGGDDTVGSPDEGYQLLIFDVKATLKSGSMAVFSYTQFTLWDPDDHACRSNLFSSAVDSDDRVSLRTLSESKPSAKGKIVFEVPEDKDYSTFVLSWSSTSSDVYADFAWKG